jgi:hypothetical protein
LFQIYIDEGLAKHDSQQIVPVEAEDYFHETVKFKSSEKCLGLQIADFTAFVVSKSQRIMMEKKAGNQLSRADRHILSIIPKLNHWTLELATFDEKQFSQDGYEFILKKDRKAKGLQLTPEKPDR